MKLRNGQLLEEFCKAWQREAEELLEFARRQDAEIAALRLRVLQETDRADYWHARATAPQSEASVDRSNEPYVVPASASHGPR